MRITFTSTKDTAVISLNECSKQCRFWNHWLNWSNDSAAALCNDSNCVFPGDPAFLPWSYGHVLIERDDFKDQNITHRFTLTHVESTCSSFEKKWRLFSCCAWVNDAKHRFLKYRLLDCGRSSERYLPKWFTPDDILYYGLQSWSWAFIWNTQKDQMYRFEL